MKENKAYFNGMSLQWKTKSLNEFQQMLSFTLTLIMSIDW